MKSHLKIKIKSLASEAKIIRFQERKVLAHRRAMIARQGAEKKVESLYSEYHSLREHRRNEVRTEARLSQLAYAFLREKPYEITEEANSTEFNADRVAALVIKFGGKSKQHHAEILEKVKIWAGLNPK